MTAPFDPFSALLLLFEGWRMMELLAMGALAFYAVYSAILVYHWLRYGLNPFTVLFMMALYFGISLPLAGTILSYAAL